MSNHDEQSPLLQHSREQDGEQEPQTIEFSKEDDDNPRAWSRSKKLTNIAVVAMMASKHASNAPKLCSC